MLGKDGRAHLLLGWPSPRTILPESSRTQKNRREVLWRSLSGNWAKTDVATNEMVSTIEAQIWLGRRSWCALVPPDYFVIIIVLSRIGLDISNNWHRVEKASPSSGFTSYENHDCFSEQSTSILDEWLDRPAMNAWNSRRSERAETPLTTSVVFGVTTVQQVNRDLHRRK